jgi:hypothetical protein
MKSPRESATQLPQKYITKSVLNSGYQDLRICFLFVAFFQLFSLGQRRVQTVHMRISS